MRLLATDTILLGATVIEAGETVPETVPDGFGEPQPVDTGRLLEIGVARAADDAPRKRSSKRSEE